MNSGARVDRCHLSISAIDTKLSMTALGLPANMKVSVENVVLGVC